MARNITHQIVDPGVYTWTAPSKLTEVFFIGLGAGGGGGGSQRDGAGADPASGGGGGGGGYVEGKILSIEPGAKYVVVVGLGGAGGAVSSIPYGYENAGSPGGTTSFSDATATLLSAMGGGGGIGGHANQERRSPGGQGGTFTQNAIPVAAVVGRDGGDGGASGFIPASIPGLPGENVADGWGQGGGVGDHPKSSGGNSGGGGGASARSDGGRSGDVIDTGPWPGATGGGGGAGYLAGNDSDACPNAEPHMSSGGNGGSGGAIIAYTIDDGVEDSAPVRVSD